MSVHPLTAYIRQELAKQANPVNAKSMQAYMKSEMPYHGVKTAEQRAIYKVAFKEYPIDDRDLYEKVVRELWDAEFREERYAAINLAKKHKKFQTLDSLPMYRMMIETGAWWDFVDSIAADIIGSLLSNFKAEMTKELMQWIKDEHLWIRRSAILVQLRFKSDTDYNMLFGFCEQCLEEKVFWIRKAIGWALREYSKSEPDRVREFIEKNKSGMAGLTLREASKYI